MFGIIKKMFIVLLTSLINTSNIVNASNHTKYVSLSNENLKFNILLLIYVLMNTVTNYTTIHLWLNLD